MHEDLPGGLIEESPSAASALLAWSAWAVEGPEGFEIPIVEELGGELWDPPAAADVRCPPVWTMGPRMWSFLCQRSRN
jgi:hypothetical protein